MVNKRFKQIDTKELELPETTFVRDIENRVFQAIVHQCLERIDGVSLVEATIIDSFLGREGSEKLKGIHIEQNEKNHSVKIKLEIKVVYGISLPEKAEEVQTKVAQEVSRITGLHVSCVHVIFKNLITSKEPIIENA